MPYTYNTRNKSKNIMKAVALDKSEIVVANIYKNDEKYGKYGKYDTYDKLDLLIYVSNNLHIFNN